MLHLKTKHLLLALLPAGLAVSAIAWQTKPNMKSNNPYSTEDTVPSKRRHKTIRENGKEPNETDLDKELPKLDEAMENRGTQLENIDWKKIQKEIEVSMERANEEMGHHQIDEEKIKKEVDESLKEIDFDKIKEETKLAMQQAERKIDFKKMQSDIEHSFEAAKENMNNDEFKRSIEEASKIDMSQIRKELENAKLEIEKNKVSMKEGMSKAKDGIKKAKEELKAWQQMLDEMEKDGLINTKKDYDIEYKDGDLLINHQKQPQEVLNNYKAHFKKGNTHIYKKNGGFNIRID